MMVNFPLNELGLGHATYFEILWSFMCWEQLKIAT